MSIFKTATKSIEKIGLALHGLDVIDDIVASKAPSAAQALAAISSIIGSIRNGFSSSIDAASIRDHIDKIRAGLAANDASADSELDKKFQR